MAKLTDGQVVFDKIDFDAGWENAIVLANVSPEEMKMCYICKFHIVKSSRVAKANPDLLDWTVDLINMKKLDFSPENLIAVHYGCLTLRSKLDAKKIINRIKKGHWEYDFEFYKSQGEK
ncbi:hypothetical protein SSABA_v1c07930 [Spiroplasma sabaudiense Ar-1343]|uniref:Uncharacterized protein n=1 Tax=Spiroplasma sabaudiense Ar-1343 TaxID=1276257 RepID=W6ABJ9_9MOLU|nr:hypothetical protein [Spiroplasma sabaudiense]AHI54195.1 hypothetical protein SSABA_v1c07930 [Spiroplasma sabaudiense Ar-1343]